MHCSNRYYHAEHKIHSVDLDCIHFLVGLTSNLLLIQPGSVFIGVGTLMVLQMGCEPYNRPLINQCSVSDLLQRDPNELPPFYRTGLPVVDNIGCFLTVCGYLALFECFDSVDWTKDGPDILCI